MMKGVKTMMEMKKLIDVIPTLITNGIFSHIDNPIWSEQFTDSFLDLHFGSLYSQKWVSPLVSIMVGDDDVISDENLSRLANSIYEIRKNEWGKLFNDLMAEYNPIENTDAMETTTETKTGSGTDGNTRTLNTTNTNTGSGSANTSGTSSGSSSGTSSGTSSGADNVYGFDSAAAVGDRTNSGTNSGNSSDETESETSTETTTTSSNTEQNTGTIGDSGTHSYSETFTRNYRKHGNIGVMTNVQLLRDDTDFWGWSFVKQIFNEVADFLTLDVY